MYTRCPECLKTQAVTPEALRNGRGMVRCEQCGALFDALATLTETAEEKVLDTSSEPEPWRSGSATNPRFWRFGLMGGFALLVAQLFYFESGRLFQNPQLRAGLENVCAALDCPLPDYKNAAELTVVHNAFEPLPNRNYQFKLVLNNEAAFAMPYPAIGLTLLTYDGQPFAYRLLRPREYLSRQPEKARLPANGAAEISFEIAPPAAGVGGFHFDLSY